jgi:hypothetical protein
MSERRFRKPNALKHGAFSGHELLPWEDVNEYEDLRRGLFSEHQPEGPSPRGLCQHRSDEPVAKAPGTR